MPTFLEIAGEELVGWSFWFPILNGVLRSYMMKETIT